MIGIPFNVDDGRLHIAGLVAEGVNDDSTTNCTIRTRGTCLGRAGDLQLAYFSVCGGQIESEHGSGNAANGADLQEVPSRSRHLAHLECGILLARTTNIERRYYIPPNGRSKRMFLLGHNQGVPWLLRWPFTH